MSKKNQVDFDQLSFEDVSNIYVQTLERIRAYKSVPIEFLSLFESQIVGAVKFLGAARVEMFKKANPEQSALLVEIDRLRSTSSKAAKYNSAFIELKASHKKEVNMLKSQLNNKISHEQILEKETKNLIKLKNLELSENRELLIHRNLKKLVREQYGDLAYLALIREAADDADLELKLKGGENA